ncbi:MAG: hypothetical protein JF591_00570 [Lysobacter sp.]|nr:hypothetical protein [Lysobacter sp.]
MSTPNLRERSERPLPACDLVDRPALLVVALIEALHTVAGLRIRRSKRTPQFLVEMGDRHARLTGLPAYACLPVVEVVRDLAHMSFASANNQALRIRSRRNRFINLSHTSRGTELSRSPASKRTPLQEKTHTSPGTAL